LGHRLGEIDHSALAAAEAHSGEAAVLRAAAETGADRMRIEALTKVNIAERVRIEAAVRRLCKSNGACTR
jgi:hypothetical protein